MTRRQRLELAAGWLGVVAAVGMLIVLVMGATVTDTGSAQGCGRNWPLCRGQFIPAFAVSTFIEFSHRAVTGIEGVLIVLLAVAALALYRRERAVQVLVPLMVGALVLQAGMGAAAVMWPQSALVLALHFGISLIALATAALTALYVGWPRTMRGLPALPRSLSLATWGYLVYLYALVYTGAYVRHANDGAACLSWPVCGSSGGDAAAVATNFLHRGAAGLAVVLAVGLLVAYWRLAGERRDLFGGGLVLVLALLGQAAAGAFLVLTRLSLFGELLHAALSGVAFTAAAYLCLRVALSARSRA
ncbi:MAG: COX15/CtaA family protein, partial [Actinobacteria bacterium]|nr:COX15/CtaA family protein [Actinomycetota bacterium]